eukprot:2528049-Alexandrium_andersonii.AAC.1
MPCCPIHKELSVANRHRIEATHVLLCTHACRPTAWEMCEGLNASLSLCAWTCGRVCALLDASV